MCFINHLNAFWKSWLQFVFPFYLWSIAGLMIMLARYSTRLTGLFGNRAVPVLGTLILLSYMKLLRNAVQILHFSILTLIVHDNSNDTTVIATATSHSFVYGQLMEHLITLHTHISSSLLQHCSLCYFCGCHTLCSYSSYSGYKGSLTTGF